MKFLNKNASFEHHIDEKVEAGINLLGSEVKSIRQGRVSLKGSFVRVGNSEAYLVNAQIEPYPYARPEGYDPRRTRKLLLHKKQILMFKQKLDQGNYTIVPVSLYFRHGLAKLEIGLARGRKQYEKKELIKKREQKRELARAFSGKIH